MCDDIERREVRRSLTATVNHPPPLPGGLRTGTVWRPSYQTSV